MNTAERFVQTMTANAARVDTIKSVKDAVPLIKKFIKEHQLEPHLQVSPALQAEWSKSKVLKAGFGTTDGTHKICVSRAWGAIADTGTLVLLSGADNPTRLNFLADYHLVFLKKDLIVENKSAIWKRLEALGEMPRALNFISGPSRTADIEQTIQLGAHGPRFLWVLIEA